MTTTRQQIAARRNPPAGVASLKADNRRKKCIEIARQFNFPCFLALSGQKIPSVELQALEAAFEAGRRYPARGAKGRAR